MKARFRIVMADTERSVAIKMAHAPETISDMMEVTKQLFLAWGYAAENVKVWFEPDDYIMELHTKIDELELKLANKSKQGSNVFSLTNSEDK